MASPKFRLSLCYGIIQQHQGSIWVESAPGEGTTLIIELPVVQPAEGTDVPSNTRHILVVDDEPDIRNVLSRSLSLEPYTVDLASDGEEAWRKVQGRRYDCLIIDLKMPGMNGESLFELIREADEALAQKVIFITGDVISAATQAFIESVGNPAVRKPFDVAELRLEIRRLIGF